MAIRVSQRRDCGEISIWRKCGRVLQDELSAVVDHVRNNHGIQIPGRRVGQASGTIRNFDVLCTNGVDIQSASPSVVGDRQEPKPLVRAIGRGAVLVKIP